MSEHELDEKFVEKSGGAGVPAAETPDAVTGAGGAIQKKKKSISLQETPAVCARGQRDLRLLQKRPGENGKRDLFI